MKIGRIIAGLLAIGLGLGTPTSTRAEEIILKDGQKIVGTIVGYENDMFRVETGYGIALVRKDKILSIQVRQARANHFPCTSAPRYEGRQRKARQGRGRAGYASCRSAFRRHHAPQASRAGACCGHAGQASRATAATREPSAGCAHPRAP